MQEIVEDSGVSCSQLRLCIRDKIFVIPAPSFSNTRIDRNRAFDLPCLFGVPEQRRNDDPYALRILILPHLNQQHFRPFHLLVEKINDTFQFCRSLFQEKDDPKLPCPKVLFEQFEILLDRLAGAGGDFF